VSGDAGIRVATWNLKQAVAPQANPGACWSWLAEHVDPDLVVLTEAKIPAGGVHTGWTAIWDPAWQGPRRAWGTVVAARGLELAPVQEVPGGDHTRPLAFTWPGVTFAADVLRNGDRWATIVGHYSVTKDFDGTSCGHGAFSTSQFLDDLEPLLGTDRADRLIVAGDFNLLPFDVTDLLYDVGLIDLIDLTRDERPPLPNCRMCDLGPECGHLWTHRNTGGRNPSAQQIDFIFASEGMVNEVGAVYGGSQSYPDVWDVSDHAPVVAEFD